MILKVSNFEVLFWGDLILILELSSTESSKGTCPRQKLKGKIKTLAF